MTRIWTHTLITQPSELESDALYSLAMTCQYIGISRKSLSNISYLTKWSFRLLRQPPPLLENIYRFCRSAYIFRMNLYHNNFLLAVSGQYRVFTQTKSKHLVLQSINIYKSKLYDGWNMDWNQPVFKTCHVSLINYKQLFIIQILQTFFSRSYLTVAIDWCYIMKEILSCLSEWTQLSSLLVSHV